jgi:type IIS restriction enzyme protein
VWKEYRIVDIFEVKNTHNILSSWITENSGSVPYVTATQNNNSVSTFISYDKEMIDEGNSIFIGGKTLVISYQEKDYFSNDSHNLALYFKDEIHRTKPIQLYMISALYKSLKPLYSWGNSISKQKIQNDFVSFPTLNNKIAFSYMENFIKALEVERIKMLEAYLSATNLKDYKLTEEEENALSKYDSYKWEFFNLERLFGKATRGRRLKSADRIRGMLPFITAGEADTGISAFVGNDITIFSENTITIDMFGSAKYRNYKYGADDHVAVVHTEKNSKWTNLFLTTCIHNVANSGKFSYSRNFYAKDADELNIQLPVKNGKIDYNFMNHIGRAIEKMVIKDVVKWSAKRLEESKKEKNNV